MRLVFPTDENMGYLSQRGAHFGKAKFYTIITIEDKKIVEVEGIPNAGHSSGACGNAVSNIMNLTPDALIVSGIGGSPAQGFSKAGLNIYSDQNSPTVKHSVEAFLAGKLEKITEKGTCSVN